MHYLLTDSLISLDEVRDQLAFPEVLYTFHYLLLNVLATFILQLPNFAVSLKDYILGIAGTPLTLAQVVLRQTNPCF